MKKIGIIIGVNTDSLSEDSFPEWLEDIPDKLFNLSKEKYSKDEYGLASDIGIAYYVQKKLMKSKQYQVDILTPKDISLKKFNEYHKIFAFYEPFYHFINQKIKDKTSSQKYKEYCSIIQKYKGTYEPHLPLVKYVLNKTKYLKDLHKVGVPVLPTIFYNLKTGDSEKLLQQITNKCVGDWNTQIFITKPEMVGFSVGFKKWDIHKVQKNPKPFFKYLQSMKSYEYPRLLVQYFVKEFDQFYEIRTYWINGKYSHSIGTIIHQESLGTGGWETIDFAYPENEIVDEYEDWTEILDNSLIKDLKKMSQKIFPILPSKNNEKPLIVRFDFACCLNNKNICRDYFLNEIEYTPNLFPQYSKYVEPMEAVGKEIIRRIKL